jgi:hypothetical protein
LLSCSFSASPGSKMQRTSPIGDTGQQSTNQQQIS